MNRQKIKQVVMKVANDFRGECVRILIIELFFKFRSIKNTIIN